MILPGIVLALATWYSLADRQPEAEGIRHTVQGRRNVVGDSTPKDFTPMFRRQIRVARVRRELDESYKDKDRRHGPEYIRVTGILDEVTKHDTTKRNSETLERHTGDHIKALTYLRKDHKPNPQPTKTFQRQRARIDPQTRRTDSAGATFPHHEDPDPSRRAAVTHRKRHVMSLESAAEQTAARDDDPRIAHHPFNRAKRKPVVQIVEGKENDAGDDDDEDDADEVINIENVEAPDVQDDLEEKVIDSAVREVAGTQGKKHDHVQYVPVPVPMPKHKPRKQHKQVLELPRKVIEAMHDAEKAKSKRKNSKNIIRVIEIEKPMPYNPGAMYPGFGGPPPPGALPGAPAWGPHPPGAPAPPGGAPAPPGGPPAPPGGPPAPPPPG